MLSHRGALTQGIERRFEGWVRLAGQGTGFPNTGSSMCLQHAQRNWRSINVEVIFSPFIGSHLQFGLPFMALNLEFYYQWKTNNTYLKKKTKQKNLFGFFKSIGLTAYKTPAHHNEGPTLPFSRSHSVTFQITANLPLFLLYLGPTMDKHLYDLLLWFLPQQGLNGSLLKSRI